MKITTALIEKLIALRDGATLSDSQLRGEWFRAMQEERILQSIIHGSRKSWKVRNTDAFVQYLRDKHNLSDLDACLRLKASDEVSRAEQVTVTGNSKFVAQRTFKGFLVNCYEPIEATIAGQPITLFPAAGTFTFIADYEQFTIPAEVVIVGIENAENFRCIANQRSFFEQYFGNEAPLLFVCRYPQNQSRDLRTWLMGIPNRYVHFGDLDLAGINIYLTEFYHHLGERASFLIPDDYAQRLQKGSAQRYADQYAKFGRMKIDDIRLQSLVECIHQHKRGYDQEGFIEGVV